MTNAFQSDRTFQLWSFAVGHGLLLLRSTKDEKTPTRIDVLFKPARAMKLRASFDGLRIREATPEEATEIAADAGDSFGDFKVYVIESGGFRGYVVASAMVSHEDAGEYYDPSPLLIEPPRLID